AQAVARTDLVALVDPQVLADRDLVHALRALRRHHDDLALAALDLAEPDGAVDLRDDRRVLGPPSFEQLGHPRQTARNVAGLVDLPADLGQRGPGLDDVAVAHGELRADRDDELPQLLVPVERADLDHRVELLLPVLDDHELATTGGLVELLADGLLLDDVDELDASAEVRDDRLGVRVPTEQQVTRLDLLALLHGQGGAIGDRETAAHGPFLGAHHDLALAAR